MDDAVLVDLEVDFTGLDLFDRFAHLHGDRTGLGVRHESARTENTAQRTYFRHYVGSSDDDVHIGPTSFDFLDVFVESHVIGAGLFRFVLLVGSTKHEHPYCFTCTMRQGNDPSPSGWICAGQPRGARPGRRKHRIS